MRSRLLVLLLGLTASGAAVVLPATPAHASLGLYRVTASSASDSVSPKTVAVACNAGDDLLSAGGRVNNGLGDVILTRAFVNVALTTATAAAIERTATAAVWDLEVFGVCAPAGAVANLQLVEDIEGPDPNDKFPRANCPDGKLAFGGGFKLEDAFGLVSVDELEFSPTLNWVEANAYNWAAVGDYTFRAQAICGTPAASMSLSTWSSASNSVSPKTETTPACPAGTQTSGAGAVITGAVGNAFIATVIAKTQLLVGETTVREVGAYANNWDVEVQAVCVG